MARTGIGGYIGLAEETTWGTYVAPTTFLRHRSFTPSYSRGVLSDESVLAGEVAPTVDQVVPGSVRVTAALSIPLYAVMPNFLLEQLMGADVSGAGTAASPYAFKPGEMSRSMSVVAVEPRTNGTDAVYALLGCKVTDWSISVQFGSPAMLDLNLVAADVDDSKSAPTPAVSALKAYSPIEAVATVGGTARTVRTLTVSADNALDTERPSLGSKTILEPLDLGNRSYMWEATVEHDNVDEWTRSKGAFSPAALAVTLTSGTQVLRLTSPNGIVEGNPLPALDGPGVLTVDAAYRAYKSGANEALQIDRWAA